ncbi:hypothetical protein V3C99_016408 [Haemonchus contortus]|uniref:Lipoprotein n=1 Tax=Haemonchus contortus TaxID=6289 RepID=A0A7I4YZN8_HAECO
MKRLLFAMVLLLTLVFFSQCSPLFSTRPRRDLKALERIMREMIESGGIVNPAFRPGR